MFFALPSWELVLREWRGVHRRSCHHSGRAYPDKEVILLREQGRGRQDQLEFDLDSTEDQSLVLFVFSIFFFWHTRVGARRCPFDGFAS